MKIQSLAQLYERLPENERLMLDVLRDIVKSSIPQDCKEKISYNVPFFYRNRGICIIWPASIPRGGFKEGVLLGFWQGYQLADVDRYFDKGTNKKIFYKIYKHVEEIDIEAIQKLLTEAIRVDRLKK